jgi:hypothetical protein
LRIMIRKLGVLIYRALFKRYGNVPYRTVP